jgi:dihydroneopterin aldolase
VIGRFVSLTPLLTLLLVVHISSEWVPSTVTLTFIGVISGFKVFALGCQLWARKTSEPVGAGDATAYGIEQGSIRSPQRGNGAGMTDEVFLEGVQFYGYHGVNPEERTLGQRFVVDVHLTTDLRKAGQSDDLIDTINYSAVAKRVRAIVEGPPRELIEAVAEEIATALLADHPQAMSVTVSLRKPGAALKGIMMDAAGIRLRRSRGGDDR